MTSLGLWGCFEGLVGRFNVAKTGRKAEGGVAGG